jgi:type IV pilus assembly protein PilX
MNPAHRPHRGLATRAAGPQRGVVLLFTLIALAILLVGAIALVRSFNTSLFTAGNVAFKRDLANQAERAVPVLLTALTAGTGTLNTPALRGDNRAASNYSAVALPVNNQGIPTILLADNATFNAAWTAGDVTAPNDQSGRNPGVTIRYVIDRLCSATGDETALGDQCIRGTDVVRGGSSLEQQAADTAAPQPVVYRLSIRVTGPRNTQSFYQTTFRF